MVRNLMMKRLCCALVVPLVIVLAADTLSGCGPKQEAKKPAPKPVPSKTVGPRQAITVGSFRYELLASEEATIIGRKDLITSARSKGRFVILQMRAELVASRPRTLDRREITVVDSKKKSYRSSQDAQGALTAAKKPNFFKQDTYYRGIPVEGWVAFDVDKKAKGLRIRITNLVEPTSFEGYITIPE